MPSQAALDRGQAVGQGIIEAHQAANGGKLPETVAVSAPHTGMDLKYSSIDLSNGIGQHMQSSEQRESSASLRLCASADCLQCLTLPAPMLPSPS